MRVFDMLFLNAKCAVHGNECYSFFNALFRCWCCFHFSFFALNVTNPSLWRSFNSIQVPYRPLHKGPMRTYCLCWFLLLMFMLLGAEHASHGIQQMQPRQNADSTNTNRLYAEKCTSIKYVQQITFLFTNKIVSRLSDQHGVDVAISAHMQCAPNARWQLPVFGRTGLGCSDDSRLDTTNH